MLATILSEIRFYFKVINRALLWKKVSGSMSASHMGNRGKRIEIFYCFSIKATIW
ncbi:hypothetical protein KSI01_01690 [Kurthia sibirica]|nr:hypothetical protein KSI01_01690 [Kurthia sibirica]